MTLIEFFEKNATENICSSLTRAPERVIFIGDNAKLMQKHAARYKAVLSARGSDVEFICHAVNKNKMQTIVDALTGYIERYDDIVFDLTGGEELYLVATGIVFERFKHKNIQMHRFNIKKGTVVDGDGDGNTILTEDAPKLTVEENIRIWGGGVVYDEQREDATYRWDMNDDFKKDINTMWDICRGDVGKWNTQIGIFNAAQALSDEPHALTITVSIDMLREEVELRGGKYWYSRTIVDALERAGLIRIFNYGDQFCITYKNEQVKRCLTVSGLVLEMKVYLVALEAREKDGRATYNDVMNGVYIDWDGEIHDEPYKYDTKNEIDVIMMRGMVPIFVSCKNGYIDMEELYKLTAVADRFGGKYSKKVLVATALDNLDRCNYIRQRAEDMGIHLVEGVGKNENFKRLVELDDDELERIVRSLGAN